MFLAMEHEATPDEQAELDEHLAACEACRDEWQALQAVERLFASATAVEPPPTLVPGVMQGVARYRQRQARRQRVRTLLYLLAGGLALAVAPALLAASALEHNPAAARALMGLWEEAAAIVRALASAIETFARALLGGPAGILALAWVFLAGLCTVAWLRLVATARAKGPGAA